MNAFNWASVEAAFAKLPLPEQLEVVERLKDMTRQPPVVSVREQRKAWKELCGKLADLPADCPNDGLSGKDHDRILYGEAR